MEIELLYSHIFKDFDTNDFENICNKYLNMSFQTFKNEYYDKNRSIFLKNIDFHKYFNTNFKPESDKWLFETITHYIIYANKVNYIDQLNKIPNSSLVNNESINTSIINQLSSILMSFAYRTIVYDVNRKRVKELSNEGSEEEQFQSYVNGLNDVDNLERFVKEYETLISYLEIALVHLDKSIKFFFERLYDNYEDLVEHFKLNKSSLVDIHLAKGDFHNDFSMVIKCKFKETSIYFKPRSGHIDEFYKSLLESFNNNHIIKIQSTDNLLYNNYFWVQEIKYDTCKNEMEVSKFYYRLGVHLAFLYSLNAIDFHSENIIAKGEFPVLIDLESVISNRFKNKNFTDATDLNNFLLATSVNSTGILPFIFGNEKSDISAIGRKGKTKSSIEVPVIKNKGKANICVIRDFIDMEESENHPKLNDKFIDEKLYVTDLEQGFTAAYQHILNKKEEITTSIIENNLIIARFIPKPTMHYSNLIGLSFHPMISQNKALREFFIAAQIYKSNDELSIYEIKDMVNLNIPYFTYNIDSTYLYHNEDSIENYFQTSTNLNLIEKIKFMNESDLKEQLTIINNALTTDVNLEANEESTKNIKDFSKNSEVPMIDIENKFHELITVIHSIIEEKEVNFENTYSWRTGILAGNVGTRNFHTLVMDNNLYDGLSGMAFYYYSLYKYSNKKLYLLKSINIINNIKSHVNQQKMPLGAFDGIYSLIYILSLIYKETKEESYLEDALSLIKQHENLLDNDELNDVISGNAGVLIILINLYKITPTSNHKNFLKSMMNKCINKLIENSISINDSELSWNFITGGYNIGFAHGNSGIAYSLKLYCIHVEDKPSLRDFIKKVDAYEERLRENNSWSNIHNPDKSSEHSYAWCYGSPGITINRYLDNNDEDLDRIVEQIFKAGFSRLQCLCHGDLGNAIILKDINNKQQQKKVLNIIYSILKDKNVSDLKCGLSIDLQVVDLFNGLAGMSYALMYLLRDDLENVLKLEI